MTAMAAIAAVSKRSVARAEPAGRHPARLSSASSSPSIPPSGPTINGLPSPIVPETADASGSPPAIEHDATSCSRAAISMRAHREGSPAATRRPTARAPRPCAPAFSAERRPLAARRDARRAAKTHALPRRDAELRRFLGEPEHAIAVGDRHAQVNRRLARDDRDGRNRQLDIAACRAPNRRRGEEPVTVRELHGVAVVQTARTQMVSHVVARRHGNSRHQRALAIERRYRRSIGRAPPFSLFDFGGDAPARGVEALDHHRPLGRENPAENRAAVGLERARDRRQQIESAPTK